MSGILLSRKVNSTVSKNRWIASLSNGETIFEDYPEGMNAAWERLADYVRKNRLAITNMRLQLGFLSLDNIPSNQIGYVQKKKVWSVGQFSRKQYAVGHIDDTRRTVLHYVSDDRSSTTRIEWAPPMPFSIFRWDIALPDNAPPGEIFTISDVDYVVRKSDKTKVVASRYANEKMLAGRPRKFQLEEVIDAIAKSEQRRTASKVR